MWSLIRRLGSILEKIMQRLKLSLIAITFLLLSPSIQAGEIADLFDIASERGRAEGVVTGRFERNIRDYTQAVGDIHALVVDAGREAGCRVFDVRLKMSVKTTGWSYPVRATDKGARVRERLAAPRLSSARYVQAPHAELRRDEGRRRLRKS